MCASSLMKRRYPLHMPRKPLSPVWFRGGSTCARNLMFFCGPTAIVADVRDAAHGCHSSELRKMK